MSKDKNNWIVTSTVSHSQPDRRTVYATFLAPSQQKEPDWIYKKIKGWSRVRTFYYQTYFIVILNIAVVRER